MALSVNIRKKLGSFQLEVQFEAEQGTPLALLGASGCGKSVTLRCIAGILKPDEGRITLDGVVLYDSAAGIDLPPQQRRVGYLFQQYALFPNMTVRQNIAAAVPNRRAQCSDSGAAAPVPAGGSSLPTSLAALRRATAALRPRQDPGLRSPGHFAG